MKSPWKLAQQARKERELRALPHPQEKPLRIPRGNCLTCGLRQRTSLAKPFCGHCIQLSDSWMFWGAPTRQDEARIAKLQRCAEDVIEWPEERAGPEAA